MDSPTLYHDIVVGPIADQMQTEGLSALVNLYRTNKKVRKGLVKRFLIGEIKFRIPKIWYNNQKYFQSEQLIVLKSSNIPDTLANSFHLYAAAPQILNEVTENNAALQNFDEFNEVKPQCWQSPTTKRFFYIPNVITERFKNLKKQTGSKLDRWYDVKCCETEQMLLLCFLEEKYVCMNVVLEPL